VHAVPAEDLLSCSVYFWLYRTYDPNDCWIWYIKIYCSVVSPDNANDEKNYSE